MTGRSAYDINGEYNIIQVQNGTAFQHGRKRKLIITHNQNNRILIDKSTVKWGSFRWQASRVAEYFILCIYVDRRTGFLCLPPTATGL